MSRSSMVAPGAERNSYPKLPDDWNIRISSSRLASRDVEPTRTYVRWRTRNEPDVATATDTKAVGGPPPLPRPGLVVLMEGDQPVCRAIPFGRTPLTLGRAVDCAVRLDDGFVSRTHAGAHCVRGTVRVAWLIAGPRIT